MNPLLEHSQNLNRRQFFASASLSLGAMALASNSMAGLNNPERDAIGGIDGLKRIAPKAVHKPQVGLLEVPLAKGADPAVDLVSFLRHLLPPE